MKTYSIGLFGGIEVWIDHGFGPLWSHTFSMV
jgi:hypothetical protein